MVNKQNEGTVCRVDSTYEDCFRCEIKGSFFLYFLEGEKSLNEYWAWLSNSFGLLDVVSGCHWGIVSGGPL